MVSDIEEIRKTLIHGDQEFTADVGMVLPVMDLMDHRQLELAMEAAVLLAKEKFGGIYTVRVHFPSGTSEYSAARPMWTDVPTEIGSVVQQPSAPAKAAPQGRVKFWAKRVTGINHSTGKTNAYAVDGEFFHRSKVGDLADGDVILAGQGGEYQLAVRRPGKPATWVPFGKDFGGGWDFVAAGGDAGVWPGGPALTGNDAVFNGTRMEGVIRELRNRGF